jgi:uncharacterized membrane protein YphA (DoxX/SURF4 family)
MCPPRGKRPLDRQGRPFSETLCPFWASVIGAFRLDPMTRGKERLAAAVRIATGAIFVAEGTGKLAGDFVRGGFARSAAEMAQQSWPIWRSFLESLVIPRADVFGWIFALGELAVGIGLLFGLFTRVAAAGGAALMIAILLGQSYVPGGNWEKWITAGLTTKFALLLLLLLLAADAGRVWSLDSRLGKRGPLRRR